MVGQLKMQIVVLLSPKGLKISQQYLLIYIVNCLSTYEEVKNMEKLIEM